MAALKAGKIETIIVIIIEQIDIKKIDLKDVNESEGVISVVSYKDIPGRNDVGPVFDGDPIFPKTKVWICVNILFENLFE